MSRSKVTLYFRPFIFNCIPMLLIRLHGDFFRTVRRVGRGKQLFDGYRYSDSNFTEWKLVVPKTNIYIYNQKNKNKYVWYYQLAFCEIGIWIYVSVLEEFFTPTLPTPPPHHTLPTVLKNHMKLACLLQFPMEPICVLTNTSDIKETKYNTPCRTVDFL